MKNVILFLFLATGVLAARAQATFTVQKVEPSAVPAVVLEAQEKFFPGITVTLWEKQTASVRSKSGERYVANFQNDGQKTRARYYLNGTGISATSYYTAAQLPPAIQNAAAANYTGYTLTSGEQIQLLNQNQSFYRLRLRKAAQKLVVYVDANGNELSSNTIPPTVTEEEASE